LLLTTYTETIIQDYLRLMDDLQNYGDMYSSVLKFENYIITNPGIEIAYICIMKTIIGRILLLHETYIPPEHLRQIMQSYGYTDEDKNTDWSQRVWFEHIAALGKEAEGPFVQLNSITTFLDIGCQLIITTDDRAHSLNNFDAVINPCFGISVILHENHYNIIYQRKHGDFDSFQDLEEQDPVFQIYQQSPIGTTLDPSSDQGNLAVEYHEPED